MAASLLMEEVGVQNISVSVDAESTSSNFTRDEQLARFEIATLAIIFVVTTIGNSCVLVALSLRRTKISRMYFYILHLSIADLVTAFFNVIPQLAWEITYRFRGGDVICRSVKFAQLLGPYLSSYVLVLTAVDRYHAICRPLSYCTWPARRARMLVAGAWLFALLCCAPQIAVFSYRPVQAPDIFDCWATFEPSWGERAYVTWYATSVFLVPLVVLLYSYLCICRAIWRNYNNKKLAAAQVLVVVRHNDGPLHPRAHSIRGISRAKLKTVKLTIVVIACYIVCSTPFIAAQLWATWDPLAMHSPFWSGPTFTIVTLLASLNSCVNPWIYLAFNPDLARLLLSRGRRGAGCRAGGARPRRLGGAGPGTGGSDSSDSHSGGSSTRATPRPLSSHVTYVNKQPTNNAATLILLTNKYQRGNS